MAKKKATAKAETIGCAFPGCGKDVPVSEYAAHVADHRAATAPPQPQPPAGIPAAQFPPGAFPPAGSVMPTAPPPPQPKNPFIVAQYLFSVGGKCSGTITGVRLATVGRSDIVNRGGWFLDLNVAGVLMTARVNPGDIRHINLWRRFQQNWIGQTITCRLPLPSDATKAHWVIE